MRLTQFMDPERALWVDSGLPAALRGLSLQEIDQMGDLDDTHLNRVKAFLDTYRHAHETDWRGIPRHRNQYGRGLLLVGPPGTGKTTLAATVLCELRRRWRVGIYFTRWPEHITRLRKAIAAEIDPEELSRILGMVTRVEERPCVCLDDVGHEHSTNSKFAEDTLEALLRARYDAGHPTIITSNLSGTDWSARYSKALRSFMDQATRRVVFTGDYLRGGD